MKTLFVIVLSLLVTTTFAQSCNSFFAGQFAPALQSPNDSVYYWVTFSQIQEIHSTKGYRNIWKIKWFDYCKFEVSDDEAEGNSSIFENKKPTMCSVTFINDSTLDFSANGKSQRWVQHTGLNLWFMMSQCIPELKKLEEEKNEAIKQYEESVSKEDSLSASLDLMKFFSQSLKSVIEINKTELVAISKLFGTLKTFDSNLFYENCSSGLKKQIDQNTAEQYFDYLKNAYGEWEYFSLFSQSSSVSFFEMANGNGLAKFEFDVKFKNGKEPVRFSIYLSKENDKEEPMEGFENSVKIIEGAKTFHFINVESNDYDANEYLTQLSAAFFENFYKKNFSKIYRESAHIFQKEVPKDQAESLLTLAFSKSEGNKYKLYRHTFTINESGGFIVLHFEAETDKKFVYLSLSFTSDPNLHELAGINIQENKKQH